MLSHRNVKFIFGLSSSIREKVLPYFGKQDARLFSGVPANQELYSIFLMMIDECFSKFKNNI
jgi:hypothetical protein